MVGYMQLTQRVQRTDYYFIRANGNTAHNNPAAADCYMPGEQPRYPDTFFNGIGYCLRHNIIRIGWPNVGDLRSANPRGPLPSCYYHDLESLGSHNPDHRRYLETFIQIQKGSVVLVPDAVSSQVYVATVAEPYDYMYDPPTHPFEHAHRYPAEWDRTGTGEYAVYHKDALRLRAYWPKAFSRILNPATIAIIEAARGQAMG